ncbi:hypothetical protein [Micromonospora sp. NPDC023814]|uniref:hypothetical protein n=1 Tax=Micromonospora sp. NPDC023814 TaxID=3154596 RepID=UPI0033C58E83
MGATADQPPRVNRWQRLLDHADRRITDIAGMLHVDGSNPLDQILHAVPRTVPGAALRVTGPGACCGSPAQAIRKVPLEARSTDRG